MVSNRDQYNESRHLLEEENTIRAWALKLDGHPDHSIAKIMNLTVPTVRKYLGKAKVEMMERKYETLEEYRMREVERLERNIMHACQKRDETDDERTYMNALNTIVKTVDTMAKILGLYNKQEDKGEQEETLKLPGEEEAANMSYEELMGVIRDLHS